MKRCLVVLAILENIFFFFSMRLRFFFVYFIFKSIPGPVQVSAAAEVPATGRPSQISVVLNILAAAADDKYCADCRRVNAVTINNNVRNSFDRLAACRFLSYALAFCIELNVLAFAMIYFPHVQRLISQRGNNFKFLC